MVFISSKFRLNDSIHLIPSYETHNISAATKEYSYKYKEDIYLFVNNKQTVLERIRNSQYSDIAILKF
jgi:hypothetical protein